MVANATTDLVLGAVLGYDFEKLQPFVNSLQRTGFRGDIVFLQNRLSEPTRKSLAARGVLLPHMWYGPDGITNRWSRVWPYVAPAARLARQAFITRQLFKAILPLLTTRFFHYRDFLSRNRQRYRNVLLTDVRDVIFQSNPLEGFPGGIEAFEENNQVALKDQPANADWIAKMFGPDALERIGGYRVVCAGTIMGEVNAMLALLAEYEALLCRAKRVDIYGSDQGVYNYLCRAVLPEKVRVTANGVGRILTLGTMTAGVSEVELNARGEVIGANGLPAPVVHQFDRHPEVAQTLLAKYSTPG